MSSDQIPHRRVRSNSGCGVAGWLVLAALLLCSSTAMADFVCSRCGVLVVTGGAGALRPPHSYICGKCGKVDCEADAAKLRKEFALAKRESELWHSRAAETAATDRLSSARYAAMAQAADQRVADIRQRWAELRYICPLIGNLESDQADTPPTNSDFKTEQGKSNLRQAARNIQIAVDKLHDNIDNMSAWMALIPAPSFAVTAEKGGVGAEFGGQLDLAGVVTQWTTQYKQKLIRDYERAAQDLRDLADDPASDEYKKVAEPDLPRDIRDGVGKDPAPLNAVSISLRRNAMYIAAYRTAFERLQGARAAKDDESAKWQIDAMVRFARLGRDDAEIAARYEQVFRTQVLAALDATLAEITKQGIDWPKQFTANQGALKAGDWTAAQKAYLLKLGYGETELAALRESALKLTPADLQLAWEVERVECRGVKSDQPAPATQPAPAVAPHAHAMDSMWYFAESLKQPAK